LPSGAPGKSPELDTADVISLVIGSALDVPLRAVADAVRAYRAMTPGGTDLTDAPALICTAGGALDIFADIAVHGDSNLIRNDIIEVDLAWPSIAITDGVTGHVSRFVPVGTLATHWPTNGHRKLVQINGAALVDTIRSLFAKD
jgi:hypothetical protein